MTKYLLLGAALALVACGPPPDPNSATGTDVTTDVGTGTVETATDALTDSATDTATEAPPPAN